MHRPRIQHDTFVISAANAAACALFRCEEDWLIGQALPDLVPDDDMRGLAKLRLDYIRTKGELHDQLLPLMRADESIFWAKVFTRVIEAGKLYESLIIYQYEA